MKTMTSMMAAAAVALGIASGVAAPAWAHGDEPRHGGIVQTASDISFELVNQDGKATIYVEDHGKEVATAGAVGKLTALNGAKKTEVQLAPSGANAMTTQGDAGLAKGSKAIVSMTLADKRSVNVRFSIK
jgi:hypothetical protein